MMVKATALLKMIEDCWGNQDWIELRYLVHKSPELCSFPDPRKEAYPLHLICYDGAPVDVVEAFHKACPTAVALRDADGMTPLAYACLNERASIAVIKYLVGLYPRALHMPDNSGWIPIDYMSGTIEMVYVYFAMTELNAKLACQSALEKYTPSLTPIVNTMPTLVGISKFEGLKAIESSCQAKKNIENKIIEVKKTTNKFEEESMVQFSCLDWPMDISGIAETRRREKASSSFSLRRVFEEGESSTQAKGYSNFDCLTSSVLEAVQPALYGDYSSSRKRIPNDNEHSRITGLF